MSVLEGMDPPSPGCVRQGKTIHKLLPNVVRHQYAQKSSSQTGFTRKPSLNHIDPHSTVGQFAYAPTTQTTVVTTTTTTTTSFPPLVIRPPRSLTELDPKDYPLAASPTPQAIKKFCFDLNGTQTYYKESDDIHDAWTKVQNLVDNLEEHNGTIRTVDHESERLGIPPSLHGNGYNAEPTSAMNKHMSFISGSTRKRPVSSSSFAENSERDLITQKTKRRLTIRPHQDLISRLTRQRSKEAQTNTPSSSQNEDKLLPTHAPRPVRLVQPHLQDLQDNGANDFMDAEDDDDIFDNHPPSYPPKQATPSPLSPKTNSNLAMFTPSEKDQPSIPTPMLSRDMEDDGLIVHGHQMHNNEPHYSANLSRAASEGTVNPPSTQPLSLPSPSLSPVTAALSNGQTRLDYFSAMDIEQDENSLALEQLNNDGEEDIEGINTNAFARRQRQAQQIDTNLSAPSLLQLPQMVDYFDAMPQTMKTYLMYQFLRRCDKNTLQFVAEVVNPALKCDFLARLPMELSLNIIKYLDHQSLANAAQVSRKWRLLIDSDEWTWRRLFERDGYCLMDGELDRAVREGWGYQDPEGYLDCEKDIQALSGKISTVVGSQSINVSRKRKATRLSIKKSQKQRQSVESLGKEEFNELIHELSNKENFAAVLHAASSSPPSGIGLPSLTNLHLYKSIYRRHHIIRKSWIRPDVKPRHISFRGHQRHVVTCLQFDTEKILTGSDDTNINVYDTNTGALLNKLEGHEGGVWALEYHDNTLVSGSTDRTVRIWDIQKGECTQIFQGHTSTVRCLQILLPTKITLEDGKSAVMPKQPLIITGSRDSTLKIWKLPTKADKPFLPTESAETDSAPPNPFLIRTLQGHTHSVRAIAAYGDTLVSGSYDNSVRVWAISTGECTFRLNGHTAKVYSVVLDHKRNRCISGSMDSCVKVWSLEDGALLYTLEGHTSLVGLLDLSHDHLVSAAADASLRIWDPETGQLRHTLSAHTGAITCFQHDGHKVISGSDGTLKMWNVKTGQFTRDLLTNLSGVWQVRFDERRCVAAVQRDNVTFIEVLDFGAARDGVPEDQRGRRIVVSAKGIEIDPNEVLIDDA